MAQDTNGWTHFDCINLNAQHLNGMTLHYVESLKNLFCLSDTYPFSRMHPCFLSLSFVIDNNHFRYMYSTTMQNPSCL